ncbi:MAG: FAD-binding oxidoreductase [Planctomycetota bacterium]|nr:FAD-binding oxidoreductase [Planctomycetota bacterium]
MTAVRARLEALLGSEAVDELTLGAGHAPLPMVLPPGEAELCSVLELATHEGWRVLPVGAGSRVGACRPPAGCDLALSTRRLDAIVAYEPGDGTLTAQAGTPMAHVARTAAGGGHHLSPDVARPAATTLGGVLASGASGFDRLRHGPSRWHVLGTRIAEADGTVTQSGGRLVKNVTGYDLHRLYCGSRGSLCVILEASLRLFPLPERQVVVRAPFSEADAGLAAARVVAALPVAPVAVVLTDRPEVEGAPWSVEVVLGGRAARVAWECGEVTAALPNATVIDDGVVRAAFLRDLEPDPSSAHALRITCRPSKAAAVLDRARSVLAAVGFEVTSLLHPGVATIAIALPQGLEGLASVVEELRAIEGARVCVQGSDLPGGFEPLERPTVGLDLMRRLREALDPHGRFAPDSVLWG